VAAARKSSLNLWALKNHLLTSQKKRCKLDRNNQDENHVRMHIESRSVYLVNLASCADVLFLHPAWTCVGTWFYCRSELPTRTARKIFYFAGKTESTSIFPAVEWHRSRVHGSWWRTWKKIDVKHPQAESRQKQHSSTNHFRRELPPPAQT